MGNNEPQQIAIQSDLIFLVQFHFLLNVVDCFHITHTSVSFLLMLTRYSVDQVSFLNAYCTSFTKEGFSILVKCNYLANSAMCEQARQSALPDKGALWRKKKKRNSISLINRLKVFPFLIKQLLYELVSCVTRELYT